MLQKIDPKECKKTVLYAEDDDNSLQYIHCSEGEGHTGGCVFRKRNNVNDPKLDLKEIADLMETISASKIYWKWQKENPMQAVKTTPGLNHWWMAKFIRENPNLVRKIIAEDSK